MWSGFNPRPAHARGATSDLMRAKRCSCVSIRAPRTRAGRLWPGSLLAVMVGVSIRAPRTRAGRPLYATSGGGWYMVSIRAPRTRAGRLGASATSAKYCVFQSAPRARARGDCGPSKPPDRSRLLPRFREVRQFSPRAKLEFSKNKQNLPKKPGDRSRREKPAFWLKQQLRASRVIGSTVRLDLPVWPPHGAPSSARLCHPGNRTAANPHPPCTP